MCLFLMGRTAPDVQLLKKQSELHSGLCIINRKTLYGRDSISTLDNLKSLQRYSIYMKPARNFEIFITLCRVKYFNISICRRITDSLYICKI